MFLSWRNPELHGRGRESKDASCTVQEKGQTAQKQGSSHCAQNQLWVPTSSTLPREEIRRSTAQFCAAFDDVRNGPTQRQKPSHEHSLLVHKLWGLGKKINQKEKSHKGSA